MAGQAGKARPDNSRYGYPRLGPSFDAAQSAHWLWYARPLLARRRRIVGAGHQRRLEIQTWRPPKVAMQRPRKAGNADPFAVSKKLHGASGPDLGQDIIGSGRAVPYLDAVNTPRQQNFAQIPAAGGWIARDRLGQTLGRSRRAAFDRTMPNQRIRRSSFHADVSDRRLNLCGFCDPVLVLSVVARGMSQCIAASGCKDSIY